MIQTFAKTGKFVFRACFVFRPQEFSLQEFFRLRGNLQVGLFRSPNEDFLNISKDKTRRLILKHECTDIRDRGRKWALADYFEIRSNSSRLKLDPTPTAICILDMLRYFWMISSLRLSLSRASPSVKMINTGAPCLISPSISWPFT